MGQMPGLELVPPALAVLAVVAANYTDLRWRLIPNKLTFPLIAAGVGFHLALGLSRGDPWTAVSGLMGGGFAFAFGYALWLAGGWAGGDVKLFTALGALLPVYEAPYTASPYPASLSILFNGLILTVPVLLAYALICLARGQGIFKIEVKIAQLKEGMIPAEFIYEFEGKVRRESGWRLKPKGRVLANPNVAAGLTRGQVRALKRLVREGKLGDNMRIKRGMPFAPVLAGGVLVLVGFGDLWYYFIMGLA